MITYEFVENTNHDILKIKVKLEKRLIGQIEPVKGGGWQYFPKGSKQGGEIMKSYVLVQKSLETED